MFGWLEGRNTFVPFCACILDKRNLLAISCSWIRSSCNGDDVGYVHRRCLAEMLPMLRGEDVHSSQRYIVTLYIVVFEALSQVFGVYKGAPACLCVRVRVSTVSTPYTRALQVLLVNLFVMTVCGSFEVVGDTARIEAEKFIPVFQKAWQKLDPLALGVIAPDRLPELIKSLPRPLGCLHASNFEAEIMCRHISGNDESFDYSFTNVLLALNVYSLVKQNEGQVRYLGGHVYNPVETLRAIRVIRRELRQKVIYMRRDQFYGLSFQDLEGVLCARSAEPTGT